MTKTGVMLVNLGTPDAPQSSEVRRYLREFLSDPRVLDINPVGRWLLLNLIILPRRPAASAEAYRKVWTEQGSPLLVHGRALRDAVAHRMPDHEVVLAMRYGSPSIGQALDALHEAGCDKVLVAPLYPQYASSTTGSTIEKVNDEVNERWNTPFVSVLAPFYDDPRFIEAQARVGEPVLADLQPDHVVMSFHGLPERHIRKSDPSGRHCLAQANCCASITPTNRNCYRAQCFATARALARRLGLSDEGYSVAFQSRLGRDPWIQPYTAPLIEKLAAQGIKRLAVFCPAFVADCLETLEEIGMQAHEDFVAAGGERLELVPSLNAEGAWVEALVGLLRDALGEPTEPSVQTGLEALSS